MYYKPVPLGLVVRSDDETVQSAHGTGAEAMGEPNFCGSCGRQFTNGGRFCRHCGARRQDGEQPTLTDEPSSARGDSGGTQRARPTPEQASTHRNVSPGASEEVPADSASPDGSDPSGQMGRSAPSRVRSAQDPLGRAAYPEPPPQYPQPPGAPPPPGYSQDFGGGPSAYPVQPTYGMPPQQVHQPKGINGWLIGGTIGGVLALFGIAIAIYLAASGHSDKPAQLLNTPVLTTAAAATAPPASEDSTPVRHHPASNPSSPPATGAPITHSSTTPPVLARRATNEAGERRAVAETIERHFSLISQHNFSAAYALLAPSLQTGESSWVQAHREDGIYKVDVSVDATLHGPDSATATVTTMTTLDGSGCKTWSGSWGLTKIDGAWRISEANVNPTPC